MKETQKSICFVIGQRREQLAYSAYVEHVRKLGFAAVYQTVLIDEHCGQQLKVFNGKNLVSVTKEGLDLPNNLNKRRKWKRER